MKKTFKLFCLISTFLALSLNISSASVKKDYKNYSTNRVQKIYYYVFPQANAETTNNLIKIKSSLYGLTYNVDRQKYYTLSLQEIPNLVKRVNIKVTYLNKDNEREKQSKIIEFSTRGVYHVEQYYEIDILPSEIKNDSYIFLNINFIPKDKVNTKVWDLTAMYKYKDNKLFLTYKVYKMINLQ